MRKFIFAWRAVVTILCSLSWRALLSNLGCVFWVVIVLLGLRLTLSVVDFARAFALAH